MNEFLPYDLEREELVPLASVVLLILALIVSGFDYSLIKRGSTLLFYAVIVRIWTSARGSVIRESHIEFLLLSVGAVLVGYIIEWLVGQISGELLAIQAVALAILLSRFYVNSLNGETFRWDDPVDRYVVYIPCGVALLLPVLLFHVEFNPILGYDPNSLLTPSRDSFLTLVYLSIIAGAVIYGRIEEGWSLGN